MYFYALVEREREKGERREYLFVSRDWGLLRWTRQRIAEITKKEYDILTCQTDEYGWEDIKDEVPNVLSRDVVELPIDK